MVIIMGVLGYLLFKSKTIDPIVENLDDEIISDETDISSEWSIFTNEKYGFEFEYPTIYDTEESLSNCSPHGLDKSVTMAGRISIDVIDDEGLTPEEYMNKEIDELGLLQVEPWVDGTDASMSYRLPGSMAVGTMHYTINPMKNDGKIYAIGMERINQYCDYEDMTIWDVQEHLHDSFKFID